VIDAGGGIPDTDLGTVFEPGWRGSPARTPPVHGGPSSGAGLGLAIVRGIMSAHRGEASAQNVPGGTRFDLVLPLDALRTS
jgi:signal transduction histidine kinase